MTEGQPKFPSQESVEKLPRFETILPIEVLAEWRDDDGDLVRKERHTESNGVKTRVTVEEVTYDASGEILFVANSVTEEL